MVELHTYLQSHGCIRHYDWFICGSSVIVGGYHDQAFAVNNMDGSWIRVKRLGVADVFPSIVTDADLTKKPTVNMIDARSAQAETVIPNYCILSEDSPYVQRENKPRSFIVWVKENEWWSETLPKPDSYIFSYGDLFQDTDILNGIDCRCFGLFVTSDGGNSVSSRRVGVRLEKNVKILSDLYYDTRKWKMFSVVYDPGLAQLSVYMNDIAIIKNYDITSFNAIDPVDPNQTISVPLSINTSSTYPLIIGGRPGACQLCEFDGWIGDFMAFDRALTYDEICDIYSLTIRYEPAQDARLVYANFHGTPRFADGDTEVQFYNDSYGTIYSYTWNFGDGYTSSLKNPSHEFKSPGNYTVSLKVVGELNEHTETKNNYVVLSNNPPILFAFDPLTKTCIEGELFTVDLYIESAASGIGAFDLMFRISPSCLRIHSATPVYMNPGDNVQTMVYVVNEAEGLYKFVWRDYYRDSNGVVTNHLSGNILNRKILSLSMMGYRSADSYTMDFHPSSRVTNDAGIDYSVQLEHPHTGVVMDSPTSVSAQFIASPVTGAPPLAVTFTNQSAGSPDTFAWTFGDESTSTEPNPVHTYTEVGNYTVSLKVTKGGIEDEKMKTYYIKVVDGVTIQIIFDATTIQNGSPIGMTVSLVEAKKGISGFEFVCKFSNVSMCEIFDCQFPDYFQTHTMNVLPTGEYSISAANIDESLTGFQQDVQLFQCSILTYQTGKCNLTVSVMNTSVDDTEGSTYVTNPIDTIPLTIT